MNNIKLIQGECLEKMDELIKQNIKVDMILCDLPYETTIAKWDKMISLDILWDKYSKLINENGILVLFSSQPFTSKLIMSNLKWFKEEIVWQKDRASNFAQAKRRHLKYHENIEIFAPNKYTYNRQMQPRESKRMKQMQDNNNINFRTSISNREDNEIVFNIDYEGRSYDVYDAELKNPSSIYYNPIVNSNSKEKLPHPTQKPVALLEYLIKTYSNEGDLILDNCMGVCSTGIACLNTKRNFIGIELDIGYFETCKNRINTYIEDNNLKDVNVEIS